MWWRIFLRGEMLIGGLGVYVGGVGVFEKEGEGWDGEFEMLE